jgi:hypothetical protein
MRRYLLTDREREIIKRYLETGEKLDGFSVLLHRCKALMLGIKSDYDLIEKLLESSKRNEKD